MSHYDDGVIRFFLVLGWKCCHFKLFLLDVVCVCVCYLKIFFFFSTFRLFFLRWWSSSWLRWWWWWSKPFFFALPLTPSSLPLLNFQIFFSVVACEFLYSVIFPTSHHIAPTHTHIERYKFHNFVLYPKMNVISIQFLVMVCVCVWYVCPRTVISCWFRSILIDFFFTIHSFIHSFFSLSCFISLFFLV